MLREVAVDARQTAVLFIDVQNYNCHKGGAMYHRYTPEDLEVGSQISLCRRIAV